MADENVTLAQDITENDYPMQHAGEEIDEILSRAGKIHYGTVEYKMTKANALMRIPLELTFAPKQVIATLRQTDRRCRRWQNRSRLTRRQWQTMPHRSQRTAKPLKPLRRQHNP